MKNKIGLNSIYQFVNHKLTDISCRSVKSGRNKKQPAGSGRFEMLPSRIRARADSVIVG